MQKDKVLDKDMKAFVLEIAPSIADAAVKRALVAAAEFGGDREEKKIYKKVEKLLRNKDTLESNVIKYQREIEKLEQGIKDKTIATDLIYMSQNQLTREQIEDNMLYHFRSKLQKDKLKLEQIRNGLEIIKHKRHHEIIYMYYIADMTDFEIAKKLNINIHTCQSQRQRLIQKIAVSIHGSDIL